MAYKSFENIDVWKKAARLSADIYNQLANLKDWGFRDQLIKAGLSIPSNVAEGFERRSQREFLNFLSYAKGSCGEFCTQVYVGIDIGYTIGRSASDGSTKPEPFPLCSLALSNAATSHQET